MKYILLFSALAVSFLGLAFSVQAEEKVLTWEDGVLSPEERTCEIGEDKYSFGSLAASWNGFVEEAVAQSPSRVIEDLVDGISGWVCEGTACNPHAGPWNSDIGWLSRGTNGYRIGWDGSSMFVAGDAWCGCCYAVGAKSFYIGDRTPSSRVDFSVKGDAWSSYHSMVTNAYIRIWAGRNNPSRLIVSEYMYFPRYGVDNRDYARDLAPLLDERDNVIKVGVGLVDCWIANWNQRSWFNTMRIAYNYVPPTYSATFQKSGAQGALWGVTVNGTRMTGRGNSLSISDLEGTVEYEYDETVSGTSGTRYVCESGCSGTLSGSSTQSASYSTERRLTMQVNFPEGGGTSVPAPGVYWYSEGESVEIEAAPSEGWQFDRWNGTGSGHYSGQDNPATVTMNGPVTQTAVFDEVFPDAEILCSREDVEYEECTRFIFQTDNAFYVLDNTDTPEGVTVEEREWSFSPNEDAFLTSCVESDEAGCRKVRVEVAETGTYEAELTITDNAGRETVATAELLLLEISPRYREVAP